MTSTPISSELISRVGTLFPQGCDFLKSMSIDYDCANDGKILARDLSNGALAREDYTPLVKFTATFEGMRQSPVLAKPFSHLSGFHLQYMIPHFSFVGIAQMMRDGRVNSVDPQLASLDGVIQLAQEGFLTDTDLREYKNAQVPIANDTIIYGTAWLLEPIRVHSATGGAVANVKYHFGSSLERQPQIAHCRYGLNLSPFKINPQ